MALRFTDTKTGKSVRPLGMAAVVLLQAITRETGAIHVFPAERGNGHFQGNKNAVAAGHQESGSALCFSPHPSPHDGIDDDIGGGGQIRTLGEPALKLVGAQPQVPNNPYVFPSDGGQSHFVAADGVLGRICKRLGWTDVTPHTLRHTFGSIAGELGYSELTIAAMLGHAARSVTGRYVHIDEAVRSAVERVSGEIATLIEGEGDGVTATGSFSLSGPLLSSNLATSDGGLLTVRIGASALAATLRLLSRTTRA